MTVLLTELVANVDEDRSAKDFLGDDDDRLRDFYKLLSDCPAGEEDDLALARETLFLVGSGGTLLAPSRAMIPTGFTDPVGRFDTLDMSFFEGRVEDFLKNRLKVPTLDFETYVKDHLEEILDEGLTDDQYAALAFPRP